MSATRVLLGGDRPTIGSAAVAGNSSLRNLDCLPSAVGEYRWSGATDRAVNTPFLTMTDPLSSRHQTEDSSLVERVNKQVSQVSQTPIADQAANDLTNARKQLVELLAEIDGRLGITVDGASTAGLGAAVDAETLAAMIAARLNTERAASTAGRRGHRAGKGRRRSVLSSLLQVDVILSAIALAVVVVLLLAWMG